MYRAHAIASRVRAADLRTEMGTSELYRIRKVTHTSSVLSFLPWPSKPKYHAPLSSTDWISGVPGATLFWCLSAFLISRVSDILPDSGCPANNKGRFLS